VLKDLFVLTAGVEKSISKDAKTADIQHAFGQEAVVIDILSDAEDGAVVPGSQGGQDLHGLKWMDNLAEQAALLVLDNQALVISPPESGFIGSVFTQVFLLELVALSEYPVSFVCRDMTQHGICSGICIWESKRLERVS
jgi:hypothetical protein